MASAPPTMSAELQAIENSPELNRGINYMRKRTGEFDSSLAATLAGVAITPAARRLFDRQLTRRFARMDDRVAPLRSREVIIGAGLHAAIYSAVRVALGFGAPLVLDSAQRIGGAFAVSTGPSFYLNSRNRPGKLGEPGSSRALNVLPGSPIQPAHISNAEFQRNNDLAFLIRTMLAMNAKVWRGQGVLAVELDRKTTSKPPRLTMIGADGNPIASARRVIDARGLGTPNDLPGARIISFPQFMRQQDTPFPLRDLKRVAVVGDGDSAKTALEALLGQSPAEHLSVAAMDYVPEIDWYGRSVPSTCKTARLKFRARYQGLAAHLPGRGRITPYPDKGRVGSGYQCAYVNSRAYDLVVLCTGYVPPGSLQPDFDYVPVDNGEFCFAEKAQGAEYYQVGPMADLTISASEAKVIRSSEVPENANALFRYAGRTAALAQQLPR